MNKRKETDRNKDGCNICNKHYYNEQKSYASFTQTTVEKKMCSMVPAADKGRSPFKKPVDRNRKCIGQGNKECKEHNPERTHYGKVAW